VFEDALEPWEIWGYPILAAGTIAVLSQPLTLHLSNLWRLEVLLAVVACVLEVWHWRKTRPGLARVALIAVPTSVAYGAFNAGDPRVVYLAVLGLCVYMSLLFWGMATLERFLGRFLERLRR
jgi:hypothetical protein